MKASEAPENNKRKAPNKIYACFGVFGLIQATEIRATSKDIEYIRKDAFIEKAKKWFKRQNEWRDINGIKHCDMESFDDFKNYMKGE